MNPPQHVSRRIHFKWIKFSACVVSFLMASFVPWRYIEQNGIHPVPNSKFRQNQKELQISKKDNTDPNRRLYYDDYYSELCPIGYKKHGEPTRLFIYPTSDRRFNEVSYMAYSRQTRRKNSLLAWVGSDGKWDSISAVNLITGRVILTVKLKGVDPWGDWEAVSVGPCSSGATSRRRRRRDCVYIGNVGNNGAQRCDDRDCDSGKKNVIIYKFVEPYLNVNSYDNEVTVDVVTLSLDYFHKDMPTSRADCEAIFVDYRGDNRRGNSGDIYLVTKFPTRGELSRVGKVPAYVHENLAPGESASYSIEPVGNPLDDELKWTGVDMTPDGKLISLRSYREVFFFPRPPHISIGEAMSRQPCRFNHESPRGSLEDNPDERQFETVTMVYGRNALAEASECWDGDACNVAVSVFHLRYNNAYNSRGNLKLFRVGENTGDTSAMTIRYEAEDSTSRNGCEVAHNQKGYSGKGFVDFFGGEGSYLEWDNIFVEQEGFYNLAIRYAVFNDAYRSCAIKINNGDDPGGRTYIVIFETTQGWENWEVKVVQVKLRAGSNAVRVQSLASGPNVDYMEVSPNLSRMNPSKTSPSPYPSMQPSGQPSTRPIAVRNSTLSPSLSPSLSPTKHPKTDLPTIDPTSKVTTLPSQDVFPSQSPTRAPVVKQTPVPTRSPTVNPTSASPTHRPSMSSSPSAPPSTWTRNAHGTLVPSLSPSSSPVLPLLEDQISETGMLGSANSSQIASISDYSNRVDNNDRQTRRRLGIAMALGGTVAMLLFVLVFLVWVRPMVKKELNARTYWVL